MSTELRRLRIAFIHPDLGIGGAERLVVDAALSLQALGHSVEFYTSHHDPGHCFEETRDGTLKIHHVTPPFPRSVLGKLHILFAHARQLHLTAHLLSPWAPRYDVYFVDQLSTCVPFLRAFAGTRVVFYCHFPDMLMAYGGAFGGYESRSRWGSLKGVYRYPMDWLEEVATRQADIILANSKFTVGVFKKYFRSIAQTPRVVYPAIDVSALNSPVDETHPDVVAVISDRPTLLSLNRFEKKKNVALAIDAFVKVKSRRAEEAPTLRLVIAGGYDPRLEENITTLQSLIDLARSHSLTYNLITPSRVPLPPAPPLDHLSRVADPEVLIVLNFTSAQRTALLCSPSTKALLYTPANEHFGIVPVEAMGCGVPVLACDSGGPTESVLDNDGDGGARTGWLRAPEAAVWAEAVEEIVRLGEGEREALGRRARERARAMFGVEAMGRELEGVLREVVAMGRVEGWFGGWGVMVLAFLVAYALGPWILPA